MIYEAQPFKDRADEWIVGAIGDDGEMYMAEFSGQNARERAEEYAAWKNEGGGWRPEQLDQCSDRNGRKTT